MFYGNFTFSLYTFLILSAGIGTLFVGYFASYVIAYVENKSIMILVFLTTMTSSSLLFNYTLTDLLC